MNQSEDNIVANQAKAQPMEKHALHCVSLDGYEHFGNTCSSTDCTGLIPALPSSEAELEAYEEMYQFCAQKPPARD